MVSGSCPLHSPCASWSSFRVLSCAILSSSVSVLAVRVAPGCSVLQHSSRVNRRARVQRPLFLRGATPKAHQVFFCIAHFKHSHTHLLSVYFFSQRWPFLTWTPPLVPRLDHHGPWYPHPPRPLRVAPQGPNGSDPRSRPRPAPRGPRRRRGSGSGRSSPRAPAP